MPDGVTKTLGGILTRDQLGAVTQLMKRLDFENSGGGVIRNGSESFVAEVVRGCSYPNDFACKSPPFGPRTVQRSEPDYADSFKYSRRF